MSKRAFKNFWEAHIENLPSEQEPLLSSLLFNHGCSGTAEKLDFSQPGFLYEPVIEKQGHINLICYFDITQKETIVPLLQDWIWKNAPSTDVQWVMQKERDWLSEWKKNFKPFKLEGLNITPSWRFSKKDKLSQSVILDPGMAFGTGHHATTKFAIKQLAYLKKKKFLPKKQVLDVGAGSGILSVVAERFGVSSALAIDNDPDCWRESSKTLKINKTKKCKTSKTQIESIKKTYDVVISNIIDGILLQMKEHLWRTTKKEGYLILSGILKENSGKFISEFCLNHKCKVVNKFDNNEWTSFLVQKL